MLILIFVAIQAPEHPPPIHPRDRALLRSWTSLGKPKIQDTNVSFLRRTEYVTSWASKTTRAGPTANSGVGRIARAKPRPTNADRESPEYIKSQIAMTFDKAAEKHRDTKSVKHPSKPSLKLVGAYPVIPDLDALNGVGGYIELKFGKHPSLKEWYDTRLETGILMPLDLEDDEKETRQRKMEAHIMDPAHNPKPPGEQDYDYEFFLLPNSAQSEDFKRRYDPDNLDRNDDSLYPAMGGENDGTEFQCFKYEHVRTYETVSQQGAVDLRFDETLTLSVEDGERSGRQKAAYYYPVVSRLQIDPRRNKNMAKLKFGNTEEGERPKTDLINVQITDPSEEIAGKRREWAEFNYDQEEEVNEAAAATQDDHEDGFYEPDDEVPSQQSNGGENGVAQHSQS